MKDIMTLNTVNENLTKKGSNLEIIAGPEYVKIDVVDNVEGEPQYIMQIRIAIAKLAEVISHGDWTTRASAGKAMAALVKTLYAYERDKRAKIIN